MGSFGCGHVSPDLPQPRLFFTLIRHHLLLLYPGSSTWAHMQVYLHSDSSCCVFAVSDKLIRATEKLCLMVIDQLGPGVRAEEKKSKERKGQDKTGQGGAGQGKTKHDGTQPSMSWEALPSLFVCFVRQLHYGVLMINTAGLCF